MEKSKKPSKVDHNRHHDIIDHKATMIMNNNAILQGPTDYLRMHNCAFKSYFVVPLGLHATH
jgi:hypothetical protein